MTQPSTPARADLAIDCVLVTSRAKWRDWLAANHDTSPGVWVVTYKKSARQPTVPYNDVMEEALCFGWIDSRPQKLDDERTMLLYTPRRPKSVWSKINKERIERLIANGLMTLAGLAKIESAQADGSWEALDALGSLTVPPDLVAAFTVNPQARATFDRFTENQRQRLLFWIESAKREETRAKRIADLVDQANAGENPLNWRATRNARD